MYGLMPDSGMIQIDTNATMKIMKIAGSGDDTIGGLSGGGTFDLDKNAITCAEGISPGVEALVSSTLCVTGTTGRIILGPNAISTFRLRSPGDQDLAVLRGSVGLTLGGDIQIEALHGTIDAGDYTLFQLQNGATPTGHFANLLLPENYTGRISISDNDVVLRLAKPGTAIILR